MRISVIGGSETDEQTYDVAREVGREIASRSHITVCGGLTGVMEAVCRGAKEKDGATIGILPTANKEDANQYVDTSIATGMGNARNVLVALNGHGVIAINGGTGTLSEIAHALDLGLPVAGIDTWEIEGVTEQREAREAVDYIENQKPSRQ